ncbi:MAG: glycosyltransferase family 4 protein [Candidatus Rokubacteria bacterium]|nr:glycosyltransferase family 4 protein [Candidatus Rokubacteria bacterium]
MKSVVVVGPTPPPEGGMASQCATLVRMLRSEGVDARHLSTSPALRASLARIPGVRTVARTAAFWGCLGPAFRDADVVHVLGASYLYFFLCTAPAVRSARRHGKRVVLNYRGGAAREFFARWPGAVARVAAMADAVIVPSSFLVDVFARLGVEARVVPNVLDVDRFRFRQRAPLQPRLLVARNLEPIYDVDTALRAAARVRARRPGVTVTCAGDGSLRAELERTAARIGLDRVRFAGSVPHAEMPALYDGADIVLNPSTVDNSPNSVLEALAAGAPVVSTDVGGVRHIVRHEESALLVPPGVPDAMADAVERLLDDPALATRLAEGGRRAVDGFAWPALREPLYRAYGWHEDPCHA